MSESSLPPGSILQHAQNPAHQNVAGMISADPPNIHMNIPGVVNQINGFQWNGTIYATLEEKRRAQLHDIFRVHAIDGANRLVDLLVHEIDNLSVNRPVLVFRCTDGKVCSTQAEAEAHQGRQNEVRNLVAAIRRYPTSTISAVGF